MIYFIGEKRSGQAIKNNWHWEDNVSTARFLLGCLLEIGIDKSNIIFFNLWSDDGILNRTLIDVLDNLSKYFENTIVGMGNTVCNELDRHGIKYIKIIHPAARGKIRKKELYTQHLKERLGWTVVTDDILEKYDAVWSELAKL